jgi:hypothetical protein
MLALVVEFGLVWFAGMWYRAGLLETVEEEVGCVNQRVDEAGRSIGDTAGRTLVFIDIGIRR